MGVINLDDVEYKKTASYKFIELRFKKNYTRIGDELLQAEMINKMLGDIKLISTTENAVDFLNTYSKFEDLKKFDINSTIVNFIIHTVRIL